MAVPPQRVPDLPTRAQVGEFAAIIEALLTQILTTNHSGDHLLSVQRVHEAAQYFLRDLYRLSDQPDGGVSITKIAANLTYWVSKIKPVAIAYDTTHGKYSDDKSASEISEINERAALELGLFLLLQSEKQSEDGAFADHIRAGCGNEACNGKECIERYIRAYFAFHDRYFERFIKNAMRSQNLSQTYFIVLYDHLLFSACRPDEK